ncbi:MAG: hypothetical protein ACE5GL_08035, partial [Calditrichia bacterium]
MRTILMIFWMALLPISLSNAGIVRVPEDYPSIQAGINAAVNGDTVLVNDSTYFENINFRGKAITVASYFLTDGDTTHIHNTIINGRLPSHPDSGAVVTFFSGEDTTSVLSGFTITGGSGTTLSPFLENGKGGGGIFCWNSGPKLYHNIITQNTIAGVDFAIGGGVFASEQVNLFRLILKNNVISSNIID